MLRAAVFDLDHTLFDPRVLPRALFGDLEARVRAVATERIFAAELDAALAAAWQIPFDRVVTKYRRPEAVRAAWEEGACGGFSLPPDFGGCRRAKSGSWG